MTRMANEYERADHYRDERRHDLRPGDRGFQTPSSSEVPARFDRPLSTSMDVVLLIRAMANLEDAAALIDRFIDAKAAEQRLDAVAAGARP